MAITKALQNIHLVTMAINVPGPVAACRLRQMGAKVTKIEPLTGDPLNRSCPAWYQELIHGQTVIRLDLKSESGQTAIGNLLAEADLFLASHRPSALQRLSLDWQSNHKRYPRLSQVDIIGFPGDQDHTPGHDLTYLAKLGMLSPPQIPLTLLADIASSERAVGAALALLLHRARHGSSGHERVSIYEAAELYAAPLQYGVTAPNGPLGGALPVYNIYSTQDGWLAVAALEPHFWERLGQELNLHSVTKDGLQKIFLTKTAEEWEQWAMKRDLPLAKLNTPAKKG
ncbi:MAG TPA: CoA transferase [Candidatus Angelobacter sp.]|jgi:crotonobetainyl-CoA:carnitine CoA-transferase CaiB-like acyl-CoA transferase|nr:CoA transferase [Candidatus Angelobacter sp.]